MAELNISQELIDDQCYYEMIAEVIVKASDELLRDKAIELDKRIMGDDETSV